MKKLYLFFASLALIIVAFSPAQAQRKNTTKHDREIVNYSKDQSFDCHQIKEAYKKCKHDKKEYKKEIKEHKKDKKKHHKKHKD